MRLAKIQDNMVIAPFNVSGVLGCWYDEIHATTVIRVGMTFEH